MNEEETVTILSNKAKCLKCGDIIESKHRHDFVTCRCGNLSVDGGKSYCKRSIVEVGTYEELSVCSSEKKAQTEAA